MILLAAFALAASGEAQANMSRAEIERAFDIVRTDGIAPVSDDRIASEAARYLSLTYELADRDGKGKPPIVKDEPALVAYFDALRAQTTGRIDERLLVEQAINGMIAATGHGGGYADTESQNALAGAGAGGIGLSAKRQAGFPVVVSTIPRSASDGVLLADDVVTRIDGENTSDMTLDAFIPRLRGQPGSTITLTIVRGDAPPREIALTRALVVQPSSVTWRMEGAIGVIAVSRLDYATVGEVRTAIAAIRRQIGNPSGYLLDLRGNQGGLLDAVSALADLFMDKGPIGSQRGRKPSDIERYDATRGDDTKGAPLIVLTDRNTASGAEIVAAALQDSRRARVVGQKTFGNGEIKTVLALSGRSAISLTTGQYFTALDKPIDGNGVTPDIETVVDAPGSDMTIAAALAALASGPDNDNSSRAH